MDRASLINQVISIAKSHLGQHEQGGQNMGPIVDWSIQHYTTEVAGPWAAWCAGFASTCYLLGGYTPMKDLGSLSCDALWTNLDRRWIQFLAMDKYDASSGSLLPTTGDLIFFRPINRQEFKVNGLCHVGLVQAVASNIITVISGNEQDSVHQSFHALTDPTISGYARIANGDPFFPLSAVVPAPIL